MGKRKSPSRRGRTVVERFEQRVLLSAGSVVINEINYNPDPAGVSVEFVELTNPGDTAVDLTGAAFTNGIHYSFPASTMLAAHGYLVVSADPTTLQTLTGVSSLGPFTGALSNDGDHLIISDSGGHTLDDVNYTGGFPWPTVGGSPGYSIELINPNLDNSVPGNWRSHVPAPTSETTLIAAGATWDYRKGTSEASTPTTAWRQSSFTEDGTWVKNAATPIGFDPTVVMGTAISDMNTHYTSIFMRKTFTVADPTIYRLMRMESLYDDGFNAWINGVHVVGANVPAAEMAYNAAASTTREDNTYATFSMPLPSSYLVAGTNVITVQFFNVSLSGSTDAFFDTRLIGTSGGGSGGPTTGKQNSNFAANAPPDIEKVVNSPQQPTSGQAVTITAKVADPNGVASVSASYQIVDPGNYINYTDAAYLTSWTSLPMHDDGLNGDTAAGDGTYTVVLPATLQVDRRLIRYRVSATDGLGAPVTVPYPDDAQLNFAYFCYNGNPSWTGAVQPGVTAPVTYSAQLMNSIQNFVLITKQTDAENATWYSNYQGNDYLWTGTVVYNGQVYDNVEYRARGGVWRYAMGKNSWKFALPDNYSMPVLDNYGNPFSGSWDKINLRPLIQQRDFWHRGEQGLFESTTLKLFQLAGVPTTNTSYMQLRIIDNASQAGATQYTGDLWGLYLAIEDYDSSFVKSHNLPDGNLWDMQPGNPGGGVLQAHGNTLPSDNSDLVSYTNTYINTTPTDLWWQQNLDLSEYYSYRSIVEATHDYDNDQAAGKNYEYFHYPVDPTNPLSNKWQILPWDADLTWADNMYGGGNEPYRDRVLPRAAFNLDYKNRVRELRDLLYNPEQTGQIIDEVAAKVYTPGQPSFVDVDRAMWDYNPTMLDTTKHTQASKASQGYFYAGNPASGIIIPAPGGFAGMMQKMKNYIVSRGAYMDTNLDADSAIPGTPTVSSISSASYPADTLKFRSSAFAANGGTFASMQWRIAEVSDPTNPNYSAATPKLYEINAAWESPEITTFNSDVQIPALVAQAGHTYRVRVRMKDSTGRWSHWSSPAQFIAGRALATTPPLKVTEMMYHPADPPVGSPYTADDFEYLELYNSGSTALDLSGMTFTSGITFTFPAGSSLAAGQRGMVVKNATAFKTRYGNSLNILGSYSKKLSDSGDRVTLTTAGGQVIFDYSYLDSWYPDTDGNGYSLVVRDPLSDPAILSQASAWRPSNDLNGNPGAVDNGINPGSIVINEILTNTTQPAGNYIELYNTTPAPIDVSGWFLSDASTDLRRYKVQPGSVIAAGGYLVLYANTTFNKVGAPGVSTLFNLNADGAAINLSSVDTLGNAGGYQEQDNYGAANPEIPFGRYTTSVSKVDFTSLIAKTPGAANGSPLIGSVLMSELMYFPATGQEYMELHNITNQTVPLYDPANPSNTWKFTDGITYTFPTGVSLPADGYLLVSGGDPTAFRTQANVPAGVQVFGPYTAVDGSNVLSNSGEHVALSAPRAPEAVTNFVAYVVEDDLTYGSAAPWPVAAGTGPSLARLAGAVYGDDPANWQAGPIGGTPGTVNPFMINGSSGNDTFTLGADPNGTSVDYTVNNIGGVASGSFPISSGWYIHGLGGIDTLGIDQSVINILGANNWIDNAGGFASLNLFGSTAADTLVVDSTSQKLTWNVAPNAKVISLSNVSAVSYSDGGGNDNETVSGSIPLTVNMGLGSDTLNVASGSNATVNMLDSNGNLTINGSGNTQLVIGTGNPQIQSSAVSISISPPPPSGVVQGRVFDDANGDGKQESTEKPLAGRTVYVDSNRNGKLDSTEPSALTAADGSYAFSNLSAGKYLVREVVPAGWRRTNPSTGYQDLSLATNQSRAAGDFGQSQSAMISGSVFFDRNANGKQNTGESGLVGWTVFLDTNGNGRLDKGEKFVVTDSLGAYRFVVPAGKFAVRVVKKGGFKQTAPSAGLYRLALSSGMVVSGDVFGEVKK